MEHHPHMEFSRFQQFAPCLFHTEAQSLHRALMSPSPVSKLRSLSLPFTTAAVLMKASRLSCQIFPFSNYPDISL